MVNILRKIIGRLSTGLDRTVHRDLLPIVRKVRH